MLHKFSFCCNNAVMLNKKNKGFRRSRSSYEQSNIRSGKRKQWSESQMVGALDAVLNKHLLANKAAKLYRVLPSTLKY